MMSTLSLFKPLHRRLSIPVSRCISTSILHKQFEAYKYNGPTSSPTQLIQNHHIDTSIWNDIQLVDSDIYVNTPAKAGTTWTQEIISQLLYNGDYENKIAAESVWEVSLWAAVNLIPKESKIDMLQKQLENPNVPRRIIKTHETVESMPFNTKSKYIFVARDYRDIIWSIYNHYQLFSDFAYDEFNKKKDFDFKPLPRQNFDDGSFKPYDLWNMMLNEATPDDGNPDGWPWWSQLWIVGSWWNIKHLSNIKVIHYNNLKDDLAGNMRSIAEFLEIKIDENNFNNLVNNCRFETMKNKSNPLGEMAKLFFKEPEKFFNKGVNKRWTDVLTDEDTANYRHLAKRYLDDDGIHWLETGQFI